MLSTLRPDDHREIAKYLSVYPALRFAATCKTIRATVAQSVEQRPEMLPKRVAFAFGAALQARLAETHHIDTVREISTSEVHVPAFGPPFPLRMRHVLKINGARVADAFLTMTLGEIEFYTDHPQISVDMHLIRYPTHVDPELYRYISAMHPSLTLTCYRFMVTQETEVKGTVLPTSKRAGLPSTFSNGLMAMLLERELI
jgi:hypothetical protein